MYYLFFIKLKDCYIQILSNVIRDSIKNGVLFQPAVITRSSDNFFFTEDKQEILVSEMEKRRGILFGNLFELKKFLKS